VLTLSKPLTFVLEVLLLLSYSSRGDQFTAAVVTAHLIFVAVPSCLKYFRYLFFDGFRRLADIRWEIPSS
jgi:hypothetical protein